MEFLNSKTRLFVVSEFVDKSQNSTGYYWNKIIQGMSAVKPETYVISTRSSCDLAHLERGSEIYLCVSDDKKYKKNSLFGRVFGQIVLSFKFFFKIATNVKRNDIIFSGTNPAFLLIFIFLLKPFIGFRWILLVHDVFPENLIAAKLIRRDSILFKIAKSLFDHVYMKADALIAIGRDMQELLVSKTKDKVLVAYIPNWVDSNDVPAMPRSLEKLLPGQELNDRVVFQFFGNLGRVQGVDTLLSAIRLVKNRRAKFVFIGGGAFESILQSFIHENPDLDVSFVPSLPFSRNEEGLAACDIAIVSLASGMKGLGVPSKAYFSLAADKPILVVGDKGSELELLVSEHPDTGWYCDPANINELAGLIDEICVQDLTKYAFKPRSLVIEKFDYKVAIDQYLSLFNRVLSCTK